MTFKNYPALDAYFEHKGFKHLTEVQNRVFHPALKGNDIIAISKTGTGKTLAYLFPAITKIDSAVPQTQVLVVCPTQELSLQIYQVAKELSEFFPGVKVQRVVKGDARERIEDRQPAHLVIGTLGKLNQFFLDDEILRLEKVKCLIIDEADMMLDDKNLLDLDKIASKMPQKLQMLVFSATIPDNMNAFMRSYMHHPKLIKIDEDLKFDPNINYHLIPFKNHNHRFAIKLLEFINPSMAMIFFDHLNQLEDVSKLMHENGYDHIKLHGKMTARERSQTIKRLQNEDVRYILSTDVASRGLDLELVSDVISVGIPQDLSFFIHRSGRTGRAGREGNVYTFYAESDKNKIDQLISSGIQFKRFGLNQSGLKPMKAIDYKHRYKQSELEKEITKIVKSKPKKVKPGYKKKMKSEIEQLKRKKKREIIQKSIKEQQKEKSRQKQRDKNTNIE